MRTSIFFRLLTTLAITASLHSTLSAQNGKATTAAHSFPSPGRFHEMLAKSNGTWVGEASVWFAPGAEPVTSTSILTNTMAMNGMYQVSEIKGNIVPGKGKPWTGLRITGYDESRKVFTRAMIGDGDAAGGVYLEGPWEEITRSFTMPFKKVNPHTGKVTELKEVYRIIDDNTEILEIYTIDPTTRQAFKVLNVKWTRKN